MCPMEALSGGRSFLHNAASGAIMGAVSAQHVTTKLHVLTMMPVDLLEAVS